MSSTKVFLVLVFILSCTSFQKITALVRYQNEQIYCEKPIVPQYFVNLQYFENKSLSMVFYLTMCFKEELGIFGQFLRIKSSHFDGKKVNATMFRKYAHMGHHQYKLLVNVEISENEVPESEFFIKEGAIKLWTNGTNILVYNWEDDYVFRRERGIDDALLKQ